LRARMLSSSMAWPMPLYTTGVALEARLPTTCQATWHISKGGTG
jgi:hypothetical protein